MTPSSNQPNTPSFLLAVLGFLCVFSTQCILFYMGISKESEIRVTTSHVVNPPKPQNSTQLKPSIFHTAPVFSVKTQQISVSPINRETLFSQESRFVTERKIFNPIIEDTVLADILLKAQKAQQLGNLALMSELLMEANDIEKENPHTEMLYASMYESTKEHIKATSHYKEVFRIGLKKAGPLYEQAVRKLRAGVEEFSIELPRRSDTEYPSERELGLNALLPLPLSHY